MTPTELADMKRRVHEAVRTLRNCPVEHPQARDAFSLAHDQAVRRAGYDLALLSSYLIQVIEMETTKDE